ncbi:non-ribosomal peptide synthetase [Streptomyces reniochalinae]|uniref:non-ribosomal peptide synthetase n=1 Tax=Streptomyces reniochalinae TaxID=2250578 RepID=UPI001FE5AA31|nr:non-ribosomal peptide synthetase [Streptomyces reniochalinae]
MHDGRTTPVCELVEARVALVPDAVAVVCGGERLTYGELNERANRLAHFLMGRGVVREDLVGVCVERGVEMVVALLGAWKAGAAYVPMDPDYPRQRLGFMVGDTGASLVVTQGRLRGRVEGLCSDVVCVDEDWERIAEESGSDPLPQAGPGGLAYVIYTSGSTGTPKGVMVEHGALSDRIQTMREFYGIVAGDRTLQFASTSFDASFEQILPTLLAGGTLFVRPAGPWSPRQFIDAVRENRLTVAELTPSMWEQAVDLIRGQDDLGSQFRLMVLGGEPVRAEAVAAWYAVSSTDLINTYGPTEATITATAGALHKGEERVTIGRPIAHTETFVVDGQDNAVPPGTAGELLIGGAGLARGYLGRPELTAERFVPHPFSDDAEARVYRSGDLVRILPDGRLEHLGRLDDQIKLRGLRIELGEIEAVLTGHPDVRSAVVVAREDTPQDVRLVGYCVPAEGSRPTAELLTARCREALPSYMVPGALVMVDSLPLNAAGKVDRANLPAPGASPGPGGQPATAPQEPRSDTERLVAEIWQEVLGIDGVGAHDNFFELGGHSLLATQVANKIDLLTDVQIDLKFFFRNPTVADLARHLLDLLREES